MKTEIWNETKQKYFCLFVCLHSCRFFFFFNSKSKQKNKTKETEIWYETKQKYVCLFVYILADFFSWGLLIAAHAHSISFDLFFFCVALSHSDSESKVARTHSQTIDTLCRPIVDYSTESLPAHRENSRQQVSASLGRAWSMARWSINGSNSCRPGLCDTLIICKRLPQKVAFNRAP